MGSGDQIAAQASRQVADDRRFDVDLGLGQRLILLHSGALYRGGSSPYAFASYQLGPQPASTTSGTLSWATPSISSFTILAIGSAWDSGTSTTSSSWTVRR